MSAASHPRRLKFIDALRGLAAMSVVLFHTVAAKHVPLLLAALPAWLVIVLEHGHLGVAVFFVLSGFVIALSLHGRTVGWQVAGRFMLRRSIRLDPPYWISIVLVILTDLAASHFVAGRERQPFALPQILAHLFYLQELLGYREINPVFWTLCLEIQFYLVHVLLLATRRATVLFPVACAISLLWPLGLGPVTPAGIFLPQWHGFLLGTATVFALRDALDLRLYAAFVATALLAGILHGDEFTVVCSVTAAVIFAVGRRERLHSLLSTPMLQGLGAISYSLYLVHNPITGAVFRLGRRLGGGGSPGLELLLWGASIVACIMAAGLLWRLVEQPTLRLAQRIPLTPVTGAAASR